jgi:hypothetical protein
MLRQIPGEVEKVTTRSISKLELGRDLQNFKSVGPVFEGMPFVRYYNKPVDWSTIGSQILTRFAPKLPFRYMS